MFAVNFLTICYLLCMEFHKAYTSIGIVPLSFLGDGYIYFLNSLFPLVALSEVVFYHDDSELQPLT